VKLGEGVGNLFHLTGSLDAGANYYAGVFSRCVESNSLPNWRRHQSGSDSDPMSSVRNYQKKVNILTGRWSAGGDRS